MGTRAGPGLHRAVRADPDGRTLGDRADVRVAARVGPEAQHPPGDLFRLPGGQLEADHLDDPARDQVLERAAGHGRRRRLLVQPAAEPAAAGQHRGARAGPGHRRSDGRRHEQGADGPDEAGRARLRLPRVAAVLGDRPEQHVHAAQRGDAGHRHRAVHAQRLVRPERSRQLRQEPQLLEARAPVHGRRELQDRHRRADPHRGRARRPARRCHDLAAECRQPDREPQGDGAPQPHRGVPRAPVHGQAGREQALGRQACPPGRELRDQPRQHPHQGLRQLRTELRPRSRGVRPLAADARTSCRRSTRSTTCRRRSR